MVSCFERKKKMNRNEIHVIYGKNDIAGMAQELMEKMAIAAELKPGMRIALKPNFVIPSPAEKGATTHPEIAEGILRYFYERGFRNLVIMESSWAGKRNTAFQPADCCFFAIFP